MMIRTLILTCGALALTLSPAAAQTLLDEAPTPEVGAEPQPGLSPVMAADVDYPAGGSYDAAVATLGLDDTTRCSAHREGGMFIARGVTAAAAVAAQAGCDLVTGTPVAQSVACGVLAVVNATDLAAAIASEQCDYQDGAIDGAEIEAAFENTRTLVGATNTLDARTAGIDVRTHRMDIRDHLRDERNIERHLARCNRIVSLILPAAQGGMLEVVGELVEHRIDQAVTAGAQDRHINDAIAYHADGLVRAAAGQHSGAYTRYCEAYREFGQTQYNR